MRKARVNKDHCEAGSEISGPAEDERFRFIYSRYYPDLHRLCARIIGDTVTAEDLAQETLLRAYRHLDNLEADRLWLWLSTVARHLAVSELRRRTRRRMVPLDVVDEHVASSTDPTFASVAVASDRSHQQRLLGDALGTLKPRDLTILWRRMDEGWSYEAIARAQRMSVAAVRCSLWRSRVLLQQKLADARTVILVQPLLVFRDWVRKLRHRTNSLLSEGGARLAESGTAQVAALLSLSIVAATLGLIDIGGTKMSPGALFGRRPLRTTVEDGTTSIGGPQPARSLVRGTRPVRTSRDLIEASVKTTPPRNGGVAPRSSKFAVDVYGPNGELLFHDEGKHECGDQLADVLPDEGLVQFVC